MGTMLRAKKGASAISNQPEDCDGAAHDPRVHESLQRLRRVHHQVLALVVDGHVLGEAVVVLWIVPLGNGRNVGGAVASEEGGSGYEN